MRGVTLSSSYLSILPSTFQLTRLMRGVTARYPKEVIHVLFQLTRLMRGVTPPEMKLLYQSIKISTHTPHARRDS